MPPPAKVLAEPEVRLIVPVPVTVRFVDVAALQAVPPSLATHKLEPRFNVLTAAPLRFHFTAVIAWLFVLNVPDVSVIDSSP